MKTELRRDFEEAKNMSTCSYAGRVCMHVLTAVRTDARVMRSATALKDADYTVSVVGIVDKYSRTDIDAVINIGRHGWTCSNANGGLPTSLFREEK